MSDMVERSCDLDIAVIGLAGRFPGARSVLELWQNLRDGKESITFFREDDLEAHPLLAGQRRSLRLIKAGAVLEDIDLFDAGFFGFAAREAELLDPQHRLFLECAWQALEDAGYDPTAFSGSIGVFGGVSKNGYLLSWQLGEAGLGPAELFQGLFGNDKDFLTTRVSYKLNLRGPSVDVQTACSTSLVAVHLACQSLLNGECDLALAGGACVSVPHRSGYPYEEGSILSPDGHCRAFDARAQGTVPGNGVGIVVLKRLRDAQADGDCVRAVIRGSAINNDGSRKVGYTAPSLEGQAAVIAEALAVAQVSPDTVSYIEAHGTGTRLGDPIELAALTRAFADASSRKGFCAIGSIKTNIGHLDTAAGVAGLIKTILALQHRQLPPSLHYQTPNPQIDFAGSPFRVNARLSDWPAGETPRRAGVSSFGIGGTNAHVVLEEAPPVPPGGISRPWQVLALSARSVPALAAASSNLARHLENISDVNLADVAYTFQVGRRAFGQRRALVCRDAAEAAALLRQSATPAGEAVERPVAFLFPGQGTQHPHMARELYRQEAIFHDTVDQCCRILRPHLGFDLRELLIERRAGSVSDRSLGRAGSVSDRSLGRAGSVSDRSGTDDTADPLTQTTLAQPALFVLEYALAKLWQDWGIRPKMLAGHSLGEYAAACLSGVLSLEDALALVVARGRLIQQLPAGAMLAVPLSPAQLQPLLRPGLALAAVNGPALSVVSGPADRVEALQNDLARKGLEFNRLVVSHAFHSEMLDPILETFAQEVSRVSLHPPGLPYLSNVTGTWITAQEAVSPDYWVRHLRQTVQFGDNLHTLFQAPDLILLEVGPGQVLSTLAEGHPDRSDRHLVFRSLPHPRSPEEPLRYLLGTLGRLWESGQKIDWSRFHAGSQRRRVPLPTYPFERQRYWLGTGKLSLGSGKAADSSGAQDTDGQAARGTTAKRADVAGWFYVPSWKRSVLPLGKGEGLPPASYLIFAEESGLGSLLAEKLRAPGRQVHVVRPGGSFSTDGNEFTLNPRRRQDYRELMRALRQQDQLPGVVVHLWGLAPAGSFEDAQQLGFHSVLNLARELDEMHSAPWRLLAVTAGSQDITGEESLSPEKATVLGPCLVLPQELPHVRCGCLDVTLPATPSGMEHLAEKVLDELRFPPADLLAAYRGGHRWVPVFDPVKLGPEAANEMRLRPHGVYLITGGLGRIGLVLAELLARAVQARLILLGRAGLPPEDKWDAWLASHQDEDPLSRGIRGVRDLRALGAEVLVCPGDVADRERMAEVLALARQQFGSIHGVFHAAGDVSAGAVCPVRDTGPAEAERQFRPKVKGLLVLAELLADQEPDFVVLLSSLSAVLGGLGYSAYAAANLFLDTFARRMNRLQPGRWLSLNWDGWQWEGSAAERRGGLLVPELTLTAAEGGQAFRRLLSVREVPQLAISTADLPARIEQHARPRPLPRPGTPGTNGTNGTTRHARPALPAPFVAPRDEVERTVARLWEELLGLEQVGIEDNFFQLGGNSLVAIQILSRLRDIYRVVPPMREVFEAPTVAGLAAAINRSLAEQPNDQLEALLAEIEQLSPEDAQEALAREQGSSEATEGGLR